MADEPQPEGDLDAAAPQPCAPCRGRGRLLSGAGGTQHEVQCPWCEGGGVTIPGHDAQAARRADRESASAADRGAETVDEPAAPDQGSEPLA